MEDVSNKTLLTVLVVTIIVSMSGTILSFYRLSKLTSPQPVEFTGMVGGLQSGQVNLTVQSNLGINLIINAIDFGSGWINGSTTSCSTLGANLTTEGTYGTNTNYCWINSSGIIGTSAASFFKPFVVNNDGTINASVSISGKSNATLLNSVSNDTAVYVWKVRDIPYSSYCARSNCSATSCKFANNWTHFDSNATVCADFEWQDNKDNLTIDVWVKFPSNLTAGGYSDESVRFVASIAS
jgi:hypothetical protein